MALEKNSISERKMEKGPLEVKIDKNGDIEEGLVEERARTLIIEQKPRDILYQGKDKINLDVYLDSNPRYHNWSRACDVGHG